MRTLTFNEMSSVSGGFASGDDTLEEVVITASRPKPPQIYAQAFDIGYGSSWAPSGGGGWGGWGGGGGEVLDEVVVEAARDYCGNKDFNVPDIVPKSCKQHDKDYSEDSELSRKEADDRFLENMKKELAERHPEMPKWVRDSIANIYYNAVRENGHDSYKGKGVNDRVVREGDGIPRIPRF